MNTKHLKCWLWKILWALGFITFVLAWIANYNQGAIFGFGALAWFWTSLVLAVHAIPIKLDCHNCDVCQVAPKQMM